MVLFFHTYLKLPEGQRAYVFNFALSNKCNRGARGPSMWWGSAGQSFYLRFVSSPMGFVSKSRSVCPHTTSGNDPGASFVSCTEGPAHESWISLDLTDTYLKMTICRPWQLIFFDHCRVRLWSDQQVNSFDITLAVRGKQHELCNLLKGKILSLTRWYFGFQHFEAFWNQRLLHFKKCSASSRQWPSHTLRVPSNTVVTVTPTREGKHLRSQPQSTFHQNQAKSVCSQWSSINISLRRWPGFLDLLAATLQLPLFEESWSVNLWCQNKDTKSQLCKPRQNQRRSHGHSLNKPSLLWCQVNALVLAWCSWMNPSLSLSPILSFKSYSKQKTLHEITQSCNLRQLQLAFLFRPGASKTIDTVTRGHP